MFILILMRYIDKPLFKKFLLNTIFNRCIFFNNNFTNLSYDKLSKIKNKLLLFIQLIREMEIS